MSFARQNPDYDWEHARTTYLHGECHALTWALLKLLPGSEVWVVHRAPGQPDHSLVVQPDGTAWDVLGPEPFPTKQRHWPGTWSRWTRARFLLWLEDSWGDLTKEQEGDALDCARRLVASQSARANQAKPKRALAQRVAKLAMKCPQCVGLLASTDVRCVRPPCNTLGLVEVVCPSCGHVLSGSRLGIRPELPSYDYEVKQLDVARITEHERAKASRVEAETWAGWTHLERRIHERVLPHASQPEVQRFISAVARLLTASVPPKVRIGSRESVLIRVGQKGAIQLGVRPDGRLMWATWFPDNPEWYRRASSEPWALDLGKKVEALLASEARPNRATYPWLPLSVIDSWLPLMEDLGVSEVARSPRGFLTAYRRAGGVPSRLSPEWQHKRANFIARHMAQVARRQEPLWRDGEPTRRHLALMAWAFSPGRRFNRGI